MNIQESCLALIQVDSSFQCNLNRMCVQHFENVQEMRIHSTNMRASVYVVILVKKQQHQSNEFTYSLQSLSFCLHDKYLMQGVDVVGCQMALEPARRGFFSKRVCTLLHCTSWFYLHQTFSSFFLFSSVNFELLLSDK